MANSIETSDIVSATLGLIEAEAILGRLVYRDAEKNFYGGTGDTVRVVLPSVIPAQDGTGEATEFTDLDETAVSVQLTDEAYSAVRLSDLEATLDILDLGVQVLRPQAAGIVQYVEGVIAEQLNTAIGSATETVDPDNPVKAVAKAASEFSRRRIPREGRALVISPGLEESFLMSEHLVNASHAGDNRAVRNGSLGTVFGFEVNVSPDVEEGMVALVPEAYALAVRAPAVADSTPHASSEVSQGYAARVVQQFSIEQRANALLTSTFVGAAELDPNRRLAFSVGDGNGGSSTQDVRIVGSDTTVDVAVTGQPIEVTDVGGDDPETAASGSGKATKKKAAASK